MLFFVCYKIETVKIYWRLFAIFNKNSRMLNIVAHLILSLSLLSISGAGGCRYNQPVLCWR